MLQQQSVPHANKSVANPEEEEGLDKLQLLCTLLLFLPSFVTS